jgi:GcrA cell cycle regulator
MKTGRSGTGLCWTVQHNAALRSCLADGLSFGQAAARMSEQLGIRRSRNSCISRATRLGLHSNVKPADGYRFWPAEAVKRARAPRRTIPRSPRAPTESTLRAQFEQLRCLPVEPLHLTLLELEPGQCRYPHGDGPFTFCGHPQAAGRPYCGPHAALTVDIERIPTRRRAQMVMEAAE